MMHDDLGEWFVGFYDGHVREAERDGSKLGESRTAAGEAYARAVLSGQIQRLSDNLRVEGEALFNRFVSPLRERRRNSFRSSLEHLRDAINDDTILGHQDPTLYMAYPVGDGRDVTLFYWSFDDWRTSALERHRNAAAVTTAADEFDAEFAQVFIRRMKACGAEITGDLFVVKHERRPA